MKFSYFVPVILDIPGRFQSTQVEFDDLEKMHLDYEAQQTGWNVVFFTMTAGDAVDKDESYSPVGKEFAIRNYLDATPQQWYKTV